MDAQNSVDIALLKAQIAAMRMRQDHVRDALARASYQVSMELTLLRNGARDTTVGIINVLEAIKEALDTIARPDPPTLDTMHSTGPHLS